MGGPLRMGTLSAKFMADKLSIHNCKWMCCSSVAASQLRDTIAAYEEAEQRIKTPLRVLPKVKGTIEKLHTVAKGECACAICVICHHKS